MIVGISRNKAILGKSWGHSQKKVRNRTDFKFIEMLKLSQHTQGKNRKGKNHKERITLLNKDVDLSLMHQE